MKKENGFTLMEVLIAISVIGILVAIVISNIGDLHGKASDAIIKQELSQIIRIAEIFYTEHGMYEYPPNLGDVDGICEDQYVVEIIAKHEIDVNRCNDDPNSWALAATLENGNAWCVDSEGASYEIDPDAFGTDADDVCPSAL